MSSSASSSPADVIPEGRSDAALRVRLTGDWSINMAGDLETRLQGATGSSTGELVFDGSGVTRLDTAGALVIDQARRRMLKAERATVLEGFSASHMALIEAVEKTGLTPVPEKKKPNPINQFLSRIGKGAALVVADVHALLSTLGEASMAIGATLIWRRKMRWPALVNHIDRTGLQAIPIIMLMSFLIGMIVAQQGAFYFKTYGAELYVVDLVGVLVCREIGVLLTAIMVAGRSGSAFTAEIGSMKMREEVDALTVLGVSPIDILVVPRLLALIISLPILALASDLSALAGAWVIVVTYIGIPPETFFQRLQEALTPTYVAIGLVKAPFMALVIGLIACVEGMKVAGSAESLGLHTTASVVKAIFLVIIIDGIFAMIFGAVGI